MALFGIPGSSWLSAGATLGSALIGSGGGDDKWAKRQMNWNSFLANHQLELRKDDALRSGFHPLAALGIAPQGSTPIYTSDKTNSLGSALGAAGQALASGLQTKQITELQKERLQAETEEIRARTAKIKGDAGKSFVELSALASAQKLAAMELSGTGRSRIPPRAKKHSWNVDPSMPDSQEVEDRYSDLGSYLYAPFVAAQDFAYYARGNRLANTGVRRGRKYRKPLRTSPGPFFRKRKSAKNRRRRF